MALRDAVEAAGLLPPPGASRDQKKRYSELLSRGLATEIAAGLRAVGLPNVRPAPDRPTEREFQGGLGPKKVDVSYADERSGLMLAVSIKTICSPPYGKNLKNRFGDLCTDAITLHMRFPYAVVSALYATPDEADLDATRQRKVSTFERARILFGTITGRPDHLAAPERFEDFVVMLFKPKRTAQDVPEVELFVASPDGGPRRPITEEEYYRRLRDLYNTRNPQNMIGVEPMEDEALPGDDE